MHTQIAINGDSYITSKQTVLQWSEIDYSWPWEQNYALCKQIKNETDM
jgi:hypothetical protein